MGAINFITSNLGRLLGSLTEVKLNPASKLPDELMVKILEFLSLYDLGKLNRVSRKYRQLTKTPELWKALYIEHFENSILRMSQNELQGAKPFRELCIIADRNERLGNLKTKNKSFFVRENDCDVTVFEMKIEGSADECFTCCDSTYLVQIFNNNPSKGTTCKGYVYGLKSKKILKKIEIPEIGSRKIYHPIVDFKKSLLIGLIYGNPQQKSDLQIIVWDWKTVNL